MIAEHNSKNFREEKKTYENIINNSSRENKWKDVNSFRMSVLQNITNATYNKLGKLLISLCKAECCSISSFLPKVPFYTHFVGKKHSFLSCSEWSFSQLAWSSKFHPIFAQPAQPGLDHLLLSSCRQRTHCFHLFHPCCISNCCSPTKPTTLSSELFLNFIS